MKTIQEIYREKEKWVRWSYFFAGGITTCIIGLGILLLILKFKLYAIIV